MTILSNLIWATAGKVTSMLSGLVIGILVARYLGPEQFGLMNWVISFVFLFQTISIFGLDLIEVREEAAKPQDYNTIIGTAFGIRVALSVLSIALCIGTCVVMGKGAETTLLVAIYSLSVIANTFSVIRNYFFAIVQNKRVVQSEISRTLLGMAIKVVLLYTHASLLWFVIATMFDTILLASGYIVSYKSEVGRISQWRFSKEYARFLLMESAPLLLCHAAVMIYQRIDQVMIGELINDANVGYFSVATRFVEILVFIPMILAQTISPVLTKIRTQNEAEYYRKSQQFMNMSLWVSILAAVATSAISYWLILYLFGEAYLPAVVVLQIMSFKVASLALSNTAGSMLVIEGLQKYAIWRDVLGCIVCVALNWYLLPRYGVVAAAVISIVSNVTAGYLADAIVPAYRHLFVMQTKALVFGAKDILSIKDYILKR